MLSLTVRQSWMARVLLLIMALSAARGVLAEDLEVSEEEDTISAAAEAGRPPQHQRGVIRLTDATFEHQTQASTGQTTGSWLVWFYDDNDDVVEGRFPSESEWLGDHIVVGAVDVTADGKKVKERFGINLLPSFVYFHKGKMYRYPASNEGYSWENVRAFCKSPNSSLAETIPSPPHFLVEAWRELQNNKKYPVLADAFVFYCKTMVGLLVFLVGGLLFKAVLARLEGTPAKEKTS